MSIPRGLVWGLLLLLGAAAFLHLNADFPHNSRWIDDAARFTDEGWWASGALNQILTGHWLRPGDYNPVVAAPFWSVFIDLIFHLSGISLAVARAMGVLFTIGTVLMGGRLMARDHPHLAPAFMLLLGSSPLLFFFSRTALLEAPLIFFLTASSLAANSVKHTWWRTMLCGVLFALATLVKSTALFVAPAILYLLWFRSRQDRRTRFFALFIPFATAFSCYALYWLLVIRTHQADYHVVYQQSAPYIGVRSLEKTARLLYRCFTWLDPILFPLATVLVAASFGKLRILWRDPLFGFSLLWFLGYCAFMVWHYDAGPRYFAVLVLPVMLLLTLALGALEEFSLYSRAVGTVVLLAVALNLGYIAKLMLHPSDSLREACLQIRQQIEADPAATPLVIGHGAMESTFYTDVPALDDMGTVSVAEKLETYHPGWLVIYNDNLGLINLPGLPGHYSFVEKGSYPVFDLPSRGQLMLYRIEPR